MMMPKEVWRYEPIRPRRGVVVTRQAFRTRQHDVSVTNLAERPRTRLDDRGAQRPLDPLSKGGFDSHGATLGHGRHSRSGHTSLTDVSIGPLGSGRATRDDGDRAGPTGPRIRGRKPNGRSGRGHRRGKGKPLGTGHWRVIGYWAAIFLALAIATSLADGALAKSKEYARLTVHQPVRLPPTTTFPEIVPATPLQISLYGDSLAFQAQDSFKEALTQAGSVSVQTFTFGGTAICDWFTQMRTDAEIRRPEAVVVEFSGNTFTPCMRDGAGQPLAGASKLNKYRADAQEVIHIFSAVGARIYFVGAPISRAAAEAHSADWNQLNSLYATIPDQRPDVTYVDAGQAVEDHGAYTDTLACLADEPCTGGIDALGRRVDVVRAPDGVHFCPNASGAVLGVTADCPVWSSGAYRYGRAMAAPVVADFMARSGGGHAT